MGKLIPFLFIALDGKSAVAHLRLRIPGHKLRGSWFSFRWSPVRIVIGSHGLIATVFYFKNYATGIQRQHGMPGSCGHLQHRTGFPFSFDLLKKRGISTQGLVGSFEKLASLDGGHTQSMFDSHPPSTERAQHIRDRIASGK